VWYTYAERCVGMPYDRAGARTSRTLTLAAVFKGMHMLSNNMLDTQLAAEQQVADVC
jgi:hypothetical protein